MPAINSRCRQPHKPSFLLLDSFRPVFRQVLKSCTFLFFMLSGLLKPHNHPSLIPLISENQPFPAYSLLSFRECSHIIHEHSEGPESFSPFFRICRMVCFWNNKNNFLCLHFIHLRSRYTLLHCAEILVLVAESIGFIQDLTPSVLARSLCGKRTEFFNCKRHIMVSFF